METKKNRAISGVTPEGFIYGIHKPSYTVSNFREQTNLDCLGLDENGVPVSNGKNYPPGDVQVNNASWIYEIPNAFPFKGRTFIDKTWADNSAANPERVRIPALPDTSVSKSLKDNNIDPTMLTKLPPALQLATATTSTDPDDLTLLAEISCDFTKTPAGERGLLYSRDNNKILRPIIHNHELFEAVANNPYLPDEYKIAMVIRPGAQGSSEIVGEWRNGSNEKQRKHVYEYLRKNSYIAGGHYAANMAEDSVRYSIDELTLEDMSGLRHLYYQRTFSRIAKKLDIPLQATNKTLTTDELETLRKEIYTKLAASKKPWSPATLWGWNFGFDYAPSRYRLHASHQQIHQQFAMIPEEIDSYKGGSKKPTGKISPYSSGDLIADIIARYHKMFNRDFFTDMFAAIANNRRMDERDDLNSELVIWKNNNAMLFVPKAQTSQWELQITTLPTPDGKMSGNIVECDTAQRESLNKALYFAQKTLAGLGAKMVTSIEYSKRIGETKKKVQPLLYSLLPRLPESPGAFSENQLRFINGHYPEDFAEVCRQNLPAEAL